MRGQPETSTLKITIYDPLQDSLEEITALLHQAYAPLAAMGFNYVAATQDADVTLKRLTAGISYVAWLDDAIAGVITYYPETKTEFDEPEHYMNPEVAYFGQFAVSPTLQKLGIGNKLLELVEEKALHAGKTTLACDTAEGALHLIHFYQTRGYAPVGYHQWPHACYRSIILSKPLATGFTYTTQA